MSQVITSTKLRPAKRSDMTGIPVRNLEGTQQGELISFYGDWCWVIWDTDLAPSTWPRSDVWTMAEEKTIPG